MGTQLSPILKQKEITIDSLSNKRLAVDAHNTIYQYLSIIRQRDGTPLMDSKGNITSHLSGLFFRSINLMEKGLKLAFVFDGESPELKKKERERRKSIKQEAERQYEQAAASQDIAAMKKFASRTARLTPQIISECKGVLTALGLPIIDAPSEGEAQASYMVKKGEFYGLVSQDTDGIIFGATKLIKNLTISQKKKKNLSYETVLPEEIDLIENINFLGLDQDQLIALAILVGTDFNIGGVKGIGPKKGIGLLKKFGKDFDSMYKEAGWDFEFAWQEVFDLIKNMPHTDDYNLSWNEIDKTSILKIMVEEHDFSKDRIESAMGKLVKKQEQKGLDSWF